MPNISTDKAHVIASICLNIYLPNIFLHLNISYWIPNEQSGINWAHANKIYSVTGCAVHGS